MKEYVWKSVHFNADATMVGKELEKIGTDGNITNSEIVNYARQRKESELHKCFEWDDNIASEKYRLMQASQILFSISIVVKEQVTNTTQENIVIKETKKNDKKQKIIVEEAMNETLEGFYQAINKCVSCYQNELTKEEIKKVLFEIYKSI